MPGAGYRDLTSARRWVQIGLGLVIAADIAARHVCLRGIIGEITDLREAKIYRLSAAPAV